MPVRPAAVALLLVLAGCSATPGTIVPGVDIAAPTTTYTLELPEGYRVVEASAGTATSGADGNSSSEAFLNVLAEHVETGERALLIYQRVDLRASPVAVFRFREARPAEAPEAAEPPAGQRW